MTGEVIGHALAMQNQRVRRLFEIVSAVEIGNQRKLHRASSLGEFLAHPTGIDEGSRFE